MKISDEELKEELERFVEFGEMLNRQTRKYLAQYLHKKADPEIRLPEEIDDQYFRYFKKALDDLFDTPGLQQLIQNYEVLNRQILLDTLYWLRTTYKKIERKNPYHEEISQLENWAITPLMHVVPRWQYMMNKIEGTYRPDQLPMGFFRQKFKDLIKKRPFEEIGEADKQELELVLTDFLRQWDALLQAKIFEYQLKQLEEEKKQYHETLQAKVSEYTKLQKMISPFAQYAGRYWDMARELWKETSFKVLEKYDDLLKKEESIRELVDLLGKMREAENELEEEIFEQTIIRQDFTQDPFMRSEIEGIHESDDLTNLLSSEIGLLSDPATELSFLKKYADKNLLTLRYQDQSLTNKTENTKEVHQKIKLKEKGPFILCIDTSGSMEGKPEQIAKVLAFAVLKMAAKDNRQAYLINFSRNIETLNLLDLADSINEIAQFLEKSFHGGTDVSLPLYEAFRQLDSHAYKHADVLVISDFIMYSLEEDIVRAIAHHQQNNGTRFHSLTLSEYSNDKVIEIFDNNWQYNPQQKGIMKELYLHLKEVQEREI